VLTTVADFYTIEISITVLSPWATFVIVRLKGSRIVLIYNKLKYIRVSPTSMVSASPANKPEYAITMNIKLTLRSRKV
jgi:hypothetical protein